MDMDSIVFTEHAREALLERGISEREVRAALAAPYKTIQQSGRRFQAVAKIDVRYTLVVVYDRTDTSIDIVTAFRTSKVSKYL